MRRNDHIAFINVGIAALLLCLWIAPPIQAKASHNKHETIVIAGQRRNYIVHVPAKSSGAPMPMVIVLHGGLGNAESAEWDSRMSQKADQAGFLAVYPNGTGRTAKLLLTWNAGGCCGLAKRKDADDITFLRTMIETLEQKYNIDRCRIYVTGISNGGMLAYRAGLELSDIVAAIAPVDGCMYPSGKVAPTPVSVIVFHGTKDPIIPYSGGTGNFFGYKFKVMPITDAVAFWVDHDRCSANPLREEHGRVVKETYASGTGDTAVCLVTIKGANHAWPGGRVAVPLWFSSATRDISATEVMCNFFWEHPKKPDEIASTQH